MTIGRSIGRKIVTTKCNGQRLNKDTKELEDFSYDLDGFFTLDGATKRLRRNLGDESITIFNTQYEEHYYKMDLGKFIANSERIY